MGLKLVYKTLNVSDILLFGGCVGWDCKFGQAWGLHVPTADLQLIREFIRCKKWEVFDDAKLGATFEAKRRFFFFQKGWDQRLLFRPECIEG